MISRPTLVRRLISQAQTFQAIEELRKKIDMSPNLTESEKKQAHFQCDGRANVLYFDFL